MSGSQKVMNGLIQKAISHSRKRGTPVLEFTSYISAVDSAE
ncbi:hypothetical protein Q0590_30795 [Rhodocytophaga aerolata]|uniref:Transposase n=1 Tax=Rhodocytophaga aerolata TaxID=455078 RepID=A0ABT8RJ23_9BACT|nr:hypothetical protein [Rhodocytophaga aerolata]MDO1450702.1 hypothetical protein [Rhodocytophaga aerolata]